MNESDNYYADTAYDSRKHYDLPPIDPNKMRRGLRHRRKHRLPRGIRCGEFLALSDLRMIDHFLIDPGSLARRELEQHWEDNSVAGHRMFGGVAQPFFWISTLKLMTGLGLIFFFIPGFFLFYYTLYEQEGKSLLDYLVSADILFTLIPLCLYSLCWVLVYFRVGYHTNANYMNRRTGMLQFAAKGGTLRDRPFVEFDGHWWTSSTATGGPEIHMFMGHRQSEDGLQATAGIDAPWEAALWWEFYQTFMDISQPLPDIPESEPFRHQDPVTAEYDKRTGRDPHYWRNVGTQRAEAMKKQARERAKAMLDGDYLWLSQPPASMES